MSPYSIYFRRAIYKGYVKFKGLTPLTGSPRILLPLRYLGFNNLFGGKGLYGYTGNA